MLVTKPWLMKQIYMYVKSINMSKQACGARRNCFSTGKLKLALHCQSAHGTQVQISLLVLTRLINAQVSNIICHALTLYNVCKPCSTLWTIWNCIMYYINANCIGLIDFRSHEFKVFIYLLIGFCLIVFLKLSLTGTKQMRLSKWAYV